MQPSESRPEHYTPEASYCYLSYTPSINNTNTRNHRALSSAKVLPEIIALPNTVEGMAGADANL
ncbi:protein of unknown function [Candidatus Methylomirabilis oxygeniifera]|uniref:Uncharacterized protein n=1 Tax=Methylomirabilis oxygeniifera TaxID=671143 RepID=D5MJF1_METO1|nr:protein of unknown function [Candidatus Methylomirabilis oxyfera]